MLTQSFNLPQYEIPSNDLKKYNDKHNFLPTDYNEAYTPRMNTNENEIKKNYFNNT